MNKFLQTIKNSFSEAMASRDDWGNYNDQYEERFHPSLQDPLKWFVDWWGGAESIPGISVTTDTVKGLSALLACMKVLSETVGSTPLLFYERVQQGKKRAIEHPLYEVLRHKPNPEMSAMQWKETSMMHLTLRGNAFSEIVRDQGGRIRQLWPITPNRVRLERGDDKKLHYLIELPDGEPPADLDFEDVLHIRALAMNGLEGMTLIEAAEEVFSLGLATQKHAVKFFANDSTPSGMLEHPNKLSDEAQTRLIKQKERRHQGISNKFRMMILEEGMKWSQVGITARDAQLIETRKFQVEEIARMYRMPLHKIQHMVASTHSNIEQEAIEFLTDTIRPWLVRIEEEIMLKLLSEAERKIYYPEFLTAGLLRGDLETRNKSYAVGRQWGWLSANDVRRMENMNDIEGGDQYLVPLNMIPALMVGTQEQKSLIQTALEKNPNAFEQKNNGDKSDEKPLLDQKKT